MYGEAGLGQEVLVAEHVDLVDDKAKEGEGRVAHSEVEGLPGPRGVEAIISWGEGGRREEGKEGRKEGGKEGGKG